MTSLSKELIASFIPSIEELIHKEREHLASLKLKRRFLWDKTKVDSFIEKSQWYLDHYSTRLKQYQEYVK